MSVQVTYQSILTVLETLDSALVPDVSSPVLRHDQFNGSQSLNGSSTVPATVCAAFNKALSGGAGTIDLTAAPGTNGASVDMTGLKVQAILAKAKATNANPITLKYGASNPYNLFGASWQVILQPGQELLAFLNDAAPDVASGAKIIDLSGTGSQSVDIIIVAG